MEAKKYLGSILAASLLFGIQVRAQDIEKKETKEEEIVKKIENKVEETLVENKTEENALVVQEEAKNQNGVCSEEKSNALAYTFIATGGAVAGWVGTAIAKGCHERNVINAFKGDAIRVKTIFGLDEETFKLSQESFKESRSWLDNKVSRGEPLTLAEKKILRKYEYLEEVYYAKQNNKDGDELRSALDDLIIIYLQKELLCEKLDWVKEEVLKQEAVKTDAKDGDKKDEPKKEDKQ